MSTVIRVSVTDQSLYLVDDPLIASGGINEDVIEFTFDSLWDGFEKTAVFYRKRGNVYHVLLNENKAIIPQEVLAEQGLLFFGVFGVHNGITRTTEIQQYTIKAGAITTGSTPPAPTQSIYEQILAAMASKANVNQGVENAGKYWKVAEDGSLVVEEITGGGYTLPIASASTLGGVKINPTSGLNINADGTVRGESRTDSQYDSDVDTVLISKGTLENVKNKIVKDGMTDPSDVWTDAEQDAAIAKIGLHSAYMLNKYANSYSRLPKLKFTGDVSGMSKANEKILSFEYFGANESSATHTGYAKVKWQGSSSLAYEKKNYTIKLYSDFACTTAQNIQFVESWGSHNKYCLKANFIDHTHVRNVVAAKVWGECVKSRNTSSESYIQLHNLVNGGAIDGFPIMLFINGDYAGIYTLNIPKDAWLFGMTGTNTECVLCGETWSDVTGFRTPPVEIGTDWSYEIEPDDPSWVLPSFTAIYTALAMPQSSSVEIAAKKTALEACMDIDSVIDYILMCVCLGVSDNVEKNQLLVTFDGTKWFMSAYDLDTAFGNHWAGTSYYDPRIIQPGQNPQNNLLFKTVMELYPQRLSERKAFVMGEIFKRANILTKVLNLRTYITDELLCGETLLYPSMPSANTDGVKQIGEYMAVSEAINGGLYRRLHSQTVDGSGNSVSFTTDDNEKNFDVKELILYLTLPPTNFNVRLSLYIKNSSGTWKGTDADTWPVLQDASGARYVRIKWFNESGRWICESSTSSDSGVSGYSFRNAGKPTSEVATQENVSAVLIYIYGNGVKFPAGTAFEFWGR